MGISVRTAAAIASPFVLAACAAEVAPREEAASLHDTEASAAVEWAYEPVAADAPRIVIECTNGYDPFVCGGSCPTGHGCCITGLRPLGFCTTVDECPYRCIVDCTEAALNRSAHEGAHCLSLCTWLAPEPSCHRQR